MVRGSVRDYEPSDRESADRGEPIVVLLPRRYPRWRRWLQSLGAAVERVGYLDAYNLDPIDPWTGESYVPPPAKRVKSK